MKKQGKSAAYLNHSPEKSIDWGNKAWQLARELQHRKEEAAALKNIGKGLKRLGRNDKALEYFKNSLKIYENIKSNKNIGEEPIEPKQFRPEIPNELNDLILKMMSKIPGKRPNEEILLKTIENFRINRTASQRLT
jgi:tetratricopeptide (TPR) repeat protein